MEITMRKLALTVACALLLPSLGANAQTIADFYRGRQIRIIIGPRLATMTPGCV